MRSLLFLLFMFSELAYAKPVGLVNRGNTCYLNAVVQCFYNIQPITNFLLFNYRKNNYPADSLAEKYTNLVQAMNDMPAENSANFTVARQKMWDTQWKEFLEKARDEMLCSGSVCDRCSQRDAAEFLNKLMDELLEEHIRYPKERWEQHPLFKVLRIETNILLQCPTIRFQKSNKQTPARFLNVSTATADGQNLTTLQDCLDFTFAAEKVPGYRPDPAVAVQEDCTKKLQLTSLADDIILNLVRFVTDFTSEELSKKKLDHDIEIPRTINFKKYFSKEARQQTFYNYDLIGAVEHKGDLDGGHYIAHVKDEKTGTWYECDDARISVENPVETRSGVNQSYVLVYKKNKNKPVIEPAQQPARQTQTAQSVELTRALQQLAQSLLNLQSTL